ncbi:PLP-dependent transferase [Cadophora sp. DSE1049]|nr:PLP-dependent transferase [Cadophora sp. DSE1049]
MPSIPRLLPVRAPQVSRYGPKQLEVRPDHSNQKGSCTNVDAKSNSFPTFNRKNFTETNPLVRYLINPLRLEDEKVFNLIEKEKASQKRLLNLAPSANYCSKSVLDALGSVAQNPNSEGYLGRRYFPGTQHLDEIEHLCQQRALSAYDLDDEIWAVNVQSERLLILGSLPGSMINKYFNAVNYPQEDSFSEIDCRAVEEMIATYAPHITADSGMISAGLTKSPFEHAEILVSGTQGSLRGPSGALIFHRLNTEVPSLFSKASGEIRSLASAIEVSVFPGHQGGPHNHAIMAVAVAMGQITTPAFKTYQTLVLSNAAALKNELMLLGYCLRGNDLPSQHVAVEVEPSTARVLTHVLRAISIAHGIGPLRIDKSKINNTEYLSSAADKQSFCTQKAPWSPATATRIASLCMVAVEATGYFTTLELLRDTVVGERWG